MKKISIVGLGFVGLPLACILASLKNKYQVYGIDKKISDNANNSKKDMLSLFSQKLVDKKLITVFEKAKKNKNLIFSKSFPIIKNSDVIVVSVNFDFKKGSTNKTFKKLKNLFNEIAINIGQNTLILLETTVPPGTSEKIIIPLIKKIFLKRKISAKKINFAYSYERVMPGKNYYNSIVNINRCYSGLNKKSLNKCETFLKTFVNYKKYPLYKLDKLRDCETSKILENTYRAVNIAFIDEWTKYSSKIGVNLNKIIEGIKLRKTHNNIMSPGLGVGGYCLTKDPEFAKTSSKYLFKTDSNFPITSKSLIINKNMLTGSFNFLKKNFTKKNLKILILGASYREDIGDTRYSASLELYAKLIKAGHDVTIHDPVVSNINTNSFILKKLPNLKNFQVIIFCVAHKEYKKINFLKISKKPYYFDLNLVLDKKTKYFLRKNNFKLKVLGDD